MSGLTIEIAGLEVFAHHGVHDFERRDGQVFRFDVLADWKDGTTALSRGIHFGIPSLLDRGIQRLSARESNSLLFGHFRRSR